MKPVLEEMDNRENEICDKPCYEKRNEYTDEIADGINEQDNAQADDESADKTVKCDFLIEHIWTDRGEYGFKHKDR